MQQIRVWTVHAVSPGVTWEACFATLTIGEQSRALRMRAGVARDEFVTGRALLRGLLGGVLEQEIVLYEGLHGKPLVHGIHFNVAHAGGLVAIAICPEGEVGIDLERVDAGIDAQEIAEAHFASGERAALRAGNDQAREFVRIWTRKEAVVKALGVGLGVALHSFGVTTSDRVVFAGEEIFLQDLTVPTGWLGCVASLGCMREVDLISLNEADLLALIR